MEEVIKVINNRFVNVYVLNVKFKDNKIITFIEMYNLILI